VKSEDAAAALPFRTDAELQGWLRDYLQEHRTWGRWGDDDQRGAVNLITPEKRLAALHAARTGQVVSLSRPMSPPAEGGIGHLDNEVVRSPQFGDAVMRTAEDNLELRLHGNSITHLDALCHVWLDGVGMWNGRDPDQEITAAGARWGDVGQWADGLVGRAVLLDVPAHRGEEFVELGRPVTAEELEAVAAAQGTVVQPGDMLLVHCGRDRWEAAGDGGRSYHWTSEGRAGLAPSCVRYIREHDVSVLLWDMLESEVLSVHGVLWAFGVAIVDNCDFSRLVPLCRESGHYDFCLTIAPLNLPGATGSAVNPIAVL
jgi:hypothetical protein